MKSAKHLFLFAAMALLLPLTAMAKDNSNSGKFTVSEKVKVGSTELKPGDYKVEWDGSGDSVQVKIMQGKNTVATTSGKLVNHDTPAPYNAVILNDATGGGKAISEIDFGKRKEALVLSDGQMGAGQ
ncbi:MAG TPA: hypothetical protein VFA68_02150 [Terriglobales bacterium]|nr:hypothetical protein [Terriglobales bacterium]